MIEQVTEWPKLTQLTMEFEYQSSDGFETIDSHLSKIILKLNSGIDEQLYVEEIEISHGESTKSFLTELQQHIDSIDPDIIVTHGGDFLHFSMLQKLSDESGINLNLSRKESKLRPRTMSRIVHSYGQVIRKDSSSQFMEGCT